MLNDKKVVFSGVQPSGNLTIGNYIGAIKNFSAFSADRGHLHHRLTDAGFSDAAAVFPRAPQACFIFL